MGNGPLIVQADKSLLLDVHHPLAAEARAAIAPFAQLERSPEHMHTYRLTSVALWNARAAGHQSQQTIDALVRYSRFSIPYDLLARVQDTMDRYGKLRIHQSTHHGLVLAASNRGILEQVIKDQRIHPLITGRINATTVAVRHSERGRLKQILVKSGWPAEDLAGHMQGRAHPLLLTDDWALRDYQQEAVDRFWETGAGVIVLPCGAGKTLVGIATMARAQAATLVLVANVISGRQWKRELLARTNLTEDDIGEYCGERKEIRPITIATHHVLATRRDGVYRHLNVLKSQDWGLIIYDEVHLLPAQLFRHIAELQTRRRLGLTATLIREDHREADVFSLIGPKRYDVLWKDLETQGWISPAICTEVRISLTPQERAVYALAPPEDRPRICATASLKYAAVKRLLARHPNEQVLVIGGYLSQLDQLGELLEAPVVQGSTNNKDRMRLFDEFRSGALRILVVSKVANFAIDLPEVSVAIQVSGTFGSRQEEAQRLGRVLRPNSNGKPSHFYTVVTRDTIDLEYASHRQRFLAEQGYRYRIVDSEDI